MSFVNAIAHGNLCRDPETKATAAGMTVCAFSVASNRKVKGEERATFLDCKAFDRTAEHIAKNFRKGSRIIVSGELEQERWDDKKTGEKRTRLVLLVRSFDFVEPRNSDRDNGGEPTQAAAEMDARERRSAARQQDIGGVIPAAHHDDDVPF